MEVDVNLGAVVLAALSAMIIGSIWYMPRVFGEMWFKLARIDTGKKVTTNQMVSLYVGALVTSVLTAYVLAHVTFLSHHFFNNSFLQDALSTAFWVWLGFMATRLWVSDSFEGRPLKLTLLNAANAFVTIMTMGLIIGLVR